MSTTDFEIIAEQNRAAARGVSASTLYRRLGRGLSDRVNAETVASLVERDRIAAQLSANPAGTARLLTDIAGAGRAVDVLPSRTGALARWARRVGGPLTVAALAGGLATCSPTPAHAVAIPFQQRPVTLVISGPTTRIDIDVVSTAAIGGAGNAHAVVLSLGQATVIGTGAGPLVHVGGTVASKLLPVGSARATLVDLGDGRSTTMPVQVLRQSRLAVTARLARGTIEIAGIASHYDAPTGTYRGDQSSPVLAQVLSGGRWYTADAVTTAGVSGTITSTLTAPRGTWSIRAVRPAGANVTGATSVTVSVRVP